MLLLERKTNQNLLSSIIGLSLIWLALSTSLLSEGKHVAKHHGPLHRKLSQEEKNAAMSKEDVKRFQLVREAGKPIDLNVFDRVFSYWFKHPDVYIGHDLMDDGFHAIKTNQTNTNYRYLEILKPNASDDGRGVYFNRKNSINNLDDIVYYDIHLYDLKNIGAKLWFDTNKYDLENPIVVDPEQEEENKNDNDEEIKDLKVIDIELETFSPDASSNKELIYQVEALPLSRLLLNEQPVKESHHCDKAPQDFPMLKCLETNLLKVQPFIKCSKEVYLNLSYEYDDEELFKDVNIKKPLYQTKLNLNFPPQTKEKEDVIVYESVDDAFELECHVECSNPSTDVEYLWTIDGQNVLCTTETNKFDLIVKDYVTSVEDDDEEGDGQFLSSKSFDVVCTVNNGIEASKEFLHESQTVFKVYSKEDYEIVQQMTTTPAITTSKPGSILAGSNGTSEFGFFANLYSKVKLLVSFNV